MAMGDLMQEKQGSLVNVGLGMTLGSHITPLSRTYIEQADVVFVSASNRLIEQWVESMNPNVISLQSFYAEGKSRRDSMRFHKRVQHPLAQTREHLAGVAA